MTMSLPMGDDDGEWGEGFEGLDHGQGPGHGPYEGGHPGRYAERYGDSHTDTVCTKPSRLVSCPHCGSSQTRALQWGRRFGCIVGAVAGAAGGAAAGCIGAPRLPTRPLHWVSLVSSAVIGGISGGTVGCRSGASLGDMLDERVLPNHRCQDCAKRFCHPRR